ERLFQGGGERARLDTELSRGIVDHRLAFLLWRSKLGRRDRAAAASDGETGNRSGDQLRPQVRLHHAPFRARRPMKPRRSHSTLPMVASRWSRSAASSAAPFAVIW